MKSGLFVEPTSARNGERNARQRAGAKGQRDAVMIESLEETLFPERNIDGAASAIGFQREEVGTPKSSLRDTPRGLGSTVTYTVEHRTTPSDLSQETQCIVRQCLDKSRAKEESVPCNHRSESSSSSCSTPSVVDYRSWCRTGCSLALRSFLGHLRPSFIRVDRHVCR